MILGNMTPVSCAPDCIASKSCDLLFDCASTACRHCEALALLPVGIAKLWHFFLSALRRSGTSSCRHCDFSLHFLGQSTFFVDAVSGYGISAASAVGIAYFLKESRGKALFCSMPSLDAAYKLLLR
jgi:hypothetical protein